MTQTEALKMALGLALEVMEAAIKAGDWIVDGACDPDIAIAAIKEALAEPEQEPVVWMYQDKSTHEVKFQKHMRGFVDHGATYETPLYTTPPQRKPLDAGEISRLWKRHTSEDGPHHSPYDDDGLEFARAIEAAHGIKGEA